MRRQYGVDETNLRLSCFEDQYGLFFIESVWTRSVSRDAPKSQSQCLYIHHHLTHSLSSRILNRHCHQYYSPHVNGPSSSIAVGHPRSLTPLMRLNVRMYKTASGQRLTVTQRAEVRVQPGSRPTHAQVCWPPGRHLLVEVDALGHPTREVSPRNLTTIGGLNPAMRTRQRVPCNPRRRISNSTARLSPRAERIYASPEQALIGAM